MGIAMGSRAVHLLLITSLRTCPSLHSAGLLLAWDSMANRGCSFGSCLLLLRRSSTRCYPSGCRACRVKVRLSPVPRKRRTSRVARALFVDEGNSTQGICVSRGRHGCARGRRLAEKRKEMATRRPIEPNCSRREELSNAQIAKPRPSRASPPHVQTQGCEE